MPDTDPLTMPPMRGLPSYPEAQPVDIGPNEWDGTDVSLLDANREVRYVMPALADYVRAERAVAAKMGEPVAERLAQFLPTLGVAAREARAALDKVAALEARAKAAGRDTEAVRDFAAIDRHEARAVLRVAVDAKVGEYDALLRTEEAAASAALASLPSGAPTPADVAFAADLGRSVALMAAPALAAEVLRRYLVVDVVNAASDADRTAALRRATALLPIARSAANTLSERHGSFNAVALVLREHEVVSRDRHWYHANARRNRATQARVLVARAAATFAEVDGDLDARGAGWLRSPIAKSLGGGTA